MIGLEELLDRKPKALSGGQRQRVAMGRAIVRRPKVFLMDEPLSNLDAKLRVQMRSEVARIQHELQGDDGLRHPRPGRGDDDGRPRRADAPRRPAAGRHADAPLQRAREPVRGQLHRQPGDEPLRGRARPPQRPPGGEHRRPVPAARPRGARRPARPRALRRQQGRARHPPRAPRGRRGRDGRAERAPPAGDGAHRRGARRRADRAPRAVRPAGDDRRGQGDRRRPRRHDHRRARGRGRTTTSCRWSGASTSPRAPAPTPTLEVVVDTSRVHYFDLDTGAAIGGHPVQGV